jgi:2-oxo-4-hydroxy-4-carboxy-5-ureidoimidazoline decarboxylase
MSQQHSANQILEDWNRLEQETATKVLLPCNGSHAWAIGVVNLYPFETPEELFAASDKVWRALPEQDWQQAFDSHPRIGEHKAKAATEQSLKWSSGEQSAAQLTEDTQAALAAANREYEAKFGRIFIVCATGKTAAEMLAILRKRLANDAQTEVQEAAEQQRLITQIRLRKWLQVPQETK